MRAIDNTWLMRGPLAKLSRGALLEVIRALLELLDAG